jgi:hypothetical protein
VSACACRQGSEAACRGKSHHDSGSVSKAEVGLLQGRPLETLTPKWEGIQSSQMPFEACSSTSVTPTIYGRSRQLRTPTGSCGSSSPKGSDFGKVTNEEVQHAVELICDRARKVLKYRTANEVFREMLHSV